MQMRDFSFLLLIREQRKGCLKVHPPWQEGNVRPVRRGGARALPPTTMSLCPSPCPCAKNFDIHAGLFIAMLFSLLSPPSTVKSPL